MRTSTLRQISRHCIISLLLCRHCPVATVDSAAKPNVVVKITLLLTQTGTPRPANSIGPYRPTSQTQFKLLFGIGAMADRLFMLTHLDNVKSSLRQLLLTVACPLENSPMCIINNLLHVNFLELISIFIDWLNMQLSHWYFALDIVLQDVL